jgi:hypothetical protein
MMLPKGKTKPAKPRRCMTTARELSLVGEGGMAGGWFSGTGGGVFSMGLRSFFGADVSMRKGLKKPQRTQRAWSKRR